MQDKVVLRAIAEAIRYFPPAKQHEVSNILNRSTPALIQALEGVIRKNPRIRFSLADVAYVFGYEKTYCCKVFRRAIGKSYTQWNRAIRIEIAQELLLRSDAPICRIAEVVGYNDVSTFERNFKKATGTPPSTWRRQQ